MVLDGDMDIIEEAINWDPVDCAHFALWLASTFSSNSKTLIHRAERYLSKPNPLEHDFLVREAESLYVPEYAVYAAVITAVSISSVDRLTSYHSLLNLLQSIIYFRNASAEALYTAYTNALAEKLLLTETDNIVP